jgi:hypothetical protein
MRLTWLIWWMRPIRLIWWIRLTWLIWWMRLTWLARCGGPPGKFSLRTLK